ncbi:peritrophin-55-like [Topomyia yanbarensis]|uniref:peritrophin-55-like n=1 Tax=Topomyia yanbarensis TaxID=2498891 RepID=UPI00273A9AD1|nr:peritrophin-55-like [Topomyia yanbarensis]
MWTTKGLVFFATIVLSLLNGSEQTSWYWSCRENVGVLLFPDPELCHMYIICTQEQLHQAICPLGQIFDVYSRKCGDPGSSVCFFDLMNESTEAPTTSLTSPPTTTTTSSTLPPTTTSTLPPTTSTTLPPTTTSTLAPTTQSTLPPTTSNTLPPTTSSTVPPTESTTIPPVVSSTETIQEEPTCPDRGMHFFEHPTNCQRFFLCLMGRLSMVECPVNMRYNPNSKRCDLPWNIGCN